MSSTHDSLDDPIYIDGIRIRIFDCDRCGEAYDQIGRRATRYCMPCRKAIKNDADRTRIAEQRAFVRDVEAHPERYVDSGFLDSRGEGSPYPQIFMRKSKATGFKVRASVDLDPGELGQFHAWRPLARAKTRSGPWEGRSTAGKKLAGVLNRRARHALGQLTDDDIEAMAPTQIAAVRGASQWWLDHPGWSEGL